MKQRDILERAVGLFNEGFAEEEIDRIVFNTYGVHPEDIDPVKLYSLAYGTAITDLAARLGIDVKAFLESRGEAQKEVYDNVHIPTRQEVEKLTAAYNAGKEDNEEDHRVA